MIFDGMTLSELSKKSNLKYYEYNTNNETMSNRQGEKNQT